MIQHATLKTPSVPQFNARHIETGMWLFSWPYRGKAQCSGALNREFQCGWFNDMLRDRTPEELASIRQQYEIVELACHEAT